MSSYQYPHQTVICFVRLDFSMYACGFSVLKCDNFASLYCSDLKVFQRKVIGKIFGPVCVGDDFRIRHNSELYELLNDMAVVQRINIQRLRWLGHVIRMEEDAPARQVFDTGVYGSRRRERPCIRWKDQIN